MVMSEGMKMSKSKGNVITLLELNDKYGADAFRSFLCNSTSVESTMDWKTEEVQRMKKHLGNLYNNLEAMDKNRKEGEIKNKAFVSRVEGLVKKATDSLSKMELRDYSNVVLYDLLRVYNKTDKSPEINDYLFSNWVKMLTPIVPHIAEELWSLDNKTLVSTEAWPSYDESKIDEVAEFIENSVESLLVDVNEIKKLAKVEKLSKVKIIVAPNWKFDFFKKFKELYKTEKNMGMLIKSLFVQEHGKEISKLVQTLIKNPSKMPLVVLSQEKEFEVYKEKKDFLEKNLACKIEIELAEKSSEAKAKNAMPSKPAILVE